MRLFALLLLAIPVLAASKSKLEQPKRAERNGWIVVRLSGTPEQQAKSINAAMEKLIALCPAQYFWSYNRYKKPPGVAPAAAS